VTPSTGAGSATPRVLALIAAIATGVALAGCGAPASRSLAGPAATPAPGPPGIGSPGIVTVTGHALFVRSETELAFSDGGRTWTVRMDLATRCVNLRGKLLGGYQLVARIAMITSLPLTITGPADGTTILAQTILVPTDKDALT
jgi:hypothetical protein